MFKAFSKEKKDRPYLKLCEKCHGKGQLSYFDRNQKKVYGAIEVAHTVQAREAGSR